MQISREAYCEHMKSHDFTSLVLSSLKKTTWHVVRLPCCGIRQREAWRLAWLGLSALQATVPLGSAGRLRFLAWITLTRGEYTMQSASSLPFPCFSPIKMPTSHFGVYRPPLYLICASTRCASLLPLPIFSLICMHFTTMDHLAFLVTSASQPDCQPLPFRVRISLLCTSTVLLVSRTSTP